MKPFLKGFLAFILLPFAVNATQIDSPDFFFVAAAVPDGGVTIALLGLALVALLVVRSRMAKR